MVLNLVLGVALLTGAVLLFQRKMSGRWLVVAGCVTSIVVSVVSLAAGAFMTGPYGAVGVFDVAANLVGLLFPVATIALTMARSTTAWINAQPGPESPAPPPGWRC